MDSMRIATWPVNSINKRVRYLVHWLDSRKPDIVRLKTFTDRRRVFRQKN